MGGLTRQKPRKWPKVLEAILAALVALILIIGSGNLELLLETLGRYWWLAKEYVSFFGHMLLGGVMVVGLIAALGLSLQWLGNWLDKLR